ncbi:MAG: 4-(cytidine 5'-diphospho)-2-C-methyl-D-erythritol kinase [Deltaproteobacteria bacterium]|nr:4-(cytidine 5'-diphospho)-2-C-methyl-D-erythritol kinase [Deltaproteobacteria bacterium]
MPEMTVFSPAKVNLRLAVVGRRTDGYHWLDMLMVPLAFGDEMQIAVDSAKAGIEFESNCGEIPQDEHNLCVRAAQLMQRTAHRNDRVRIQLDKRIPVGAGLGGGSSNAAAVIATLNRLWALQLSETDLASLGVQLGADVPFFCFGRPAWVRGIGEIVHCINDFLELPILLVNPRCGVVTSTIFRSFAQSHPFQLTPVPPDASVRPLLRSVSEVAAQLRNDLEAVTTQQLPVVREMRWALDAAGAVGTLMSGSGSTVFGLFNSEEARDRAAAELAPRGWWLQATQSIC